MTTHKSIDSERDSLLNAYRIQLDIWKVQNDNYFKRIQIIMIVIQVALFTAALRLISTKPESWYEFVIPIGVAILGLLSAWHWFSLNERQNQYLEYCRRTLRNLEEELVKLDVPLRYFTLEAHVFGPLRTKIEYSAGTSVNKIGIRDIAHFNWSKEDYPGIDKKEKKLHKLDMVGGGMIPFEKQIATGAIWVWSIALIVLIYICILHSQ